MTTMTTTTAKPTKTAKTTIQTFSARNYHDVWGNAKDGFEVNDSCIIALNEPVTEIAEHGDFGKLEDAEILKYLKRIGFLKKHVRLNMLEIRNDSEWLIEIDQAKDGMPLCAIEFSPIEDSEEELDKQAEEVFNRWSAEEIKGGDHE